MGFCSPTLEAKGGNPSHTLSTRQPGMHVLGSHFSHLPLCYCTRKDRPSPIAREALRDPPHSHETWTAPWIGRPSREQSPLEIPDKHTAPCVDVGHSTAMGLAGERLSISHVPWAGCRADLRWRSGGGSLCFVPCQHCPGHPLLVGNQTCSHTCHRCPGGRISP